MPHKREENKNKKVRGKDEEKKCKKGCIKI